MRIIIICGAGYISGKEKIMLSLLKGLAKEGDDVHCITSSWSNGQFEDLLLSEKINYSKTRLGFISKTLNWKAFVMTMDQLFYWPKLLLNYKKIISRFKPDVVIHTNFHHLFLLYPVVSSKKVINIYHSHESVGNSKFYRWLFGLFKKKMVLFVGVSGYVTNKLRALGIAEDKLRTIHNGLEIPGWIPKPLLLGDIFTIGIVGQVGSWKGHEDLLYALYILKNTKPALMFRLFIFGDGNPAFVNEIKKFINEKQLHGMVQWKGFVKNTADIYNGLQLVCIPSRSEEPFATSALEAGLYGVPVIVTDRGGFPEIVNHGQNGFIVNANAPEEIANQIALLISNPKLAFETGMNHQRTVTQKFSITDFIHNWRKTIVAVKGQ